MALRPELIEGFSVVVFDEGEREQTGSGLFIHIWSSCVKSVGALWSPHINRLDWSLKSSKGGSLVRPLISVPLSSLYLLHNSESLHQHVLNDSALPRTSLSALHLCASWYGSHAKLWVWTFKTKYWGKWERCARGHTNSYLFIFCFFWELCALSNEV